MLINLVFYWTKFISKSFLLHEQENVGRNY
jgi:hypothetical protein